MRRDLVVAAGGFLTKHVQSRLVAEYCGAGTQTVCEDMEVVVRLHRYLLDRKRTYRVAFLPHPAAWTEAPEVYLDLGKQRSRWYRGLLEVLWFHRKMLFRRRYKQIGLFSMPYQLVFEALAPVIETLGYILVPLSIASGAISFRHAMGFVLLTAALNAVLSTSSVLLSVGTRGASLRKTTLFSYSRASDSLVLLLAGFLANFGYRQYLVWWQLKGLRDFLKGRHDWDKFERKGFAQT